MVEMGGQKRGGMKEEERFRSHRYVVCDEGVGKGQGLSEVLRTNVGQTRRSLKCHAKQPRL